MVRGLTPDLILDEVAAGRSNGSLPAICLFVDITGFTPLTTELMQHGIEGAEVLANVLDMLFNPLIEAVYQQGGFVAGFAGDAFKAVFPGDDADVARAATAAAWQIRRQLSEDSDQMTRFGRFHFTGKVCMAAGHVTWRIWQATEVLPDPKGQCAAFMFGGSALDACMEADPLAAAGEVILTGNVAAALAGTGAHLEPRGSHWHLVDYPDTAAGPVLPPPPAPMTRNAPHFFPEEVLQSPIQGEFRQVVTIFANVVPPDAGAEEDFFARLFELLRRYDGYLCRVGRIGGKDGGITLLLFFGAPVSHENEVSRALSFLLDLRHASVAPLQAGVSASLAFAGFVGSRRREEYTCHGVYVNLAARFMVAAPPGAIWLEANAARAATDFQLVDAGHRHFKGFATPLPVYALEGRRQTPADAFYASEMVGRAPELAALWDALSPLGRGACGGAVLVEGEPGMGKSRLVHAFAAETQHSLAALTPEKQQAFPKNGLQWFTCHTDQILRQPLNPLRRWLRDYFEQTHAEEVTRKRRFDARLDALIAATVARNLANELERSHSFLGALVDLYWEGSLYEQLEPQLRLDNTLEAIKTLIKAESARQPVVLHLEDVHWADDLTREFLARLMRGVDGFPFLLLLTSRLEDGSTASAPLAPSLLRRVIRLEALGEGELAALVAARFEGQVSPSLRHFVAKQVEGNPFFAEQLTLYLQEQRMVEPGPDGWQLSAMAPADSILSGDMRAMLTARLDRLPLPVKATVQRAAVLGREFETPVLARMLEDDPQFADHLAVASEAAIWAALAETRYLFRHALLRDAAYDMQLRSQQRALHRQAAQAIEAIYPEHAQHYAALVHHSHLGEDLPRERRYAALAGDYAAQQFANTDAVRYFSRALELTPASDGQDRFRLLLAREHANHLLGNRGAQRVDLDALLDVSATTADVAEQVEIYIRLANFAAYVGELVQAEQHARAAVQAAATIADKSRRARSLNELGRVLWQQGSYAAARQALEAAVELVAETDLRVRADSTYQLGLVSYFEQQYEGALAIFSEANAAYAAIGDLRGKVLCLRMFGAICYRRGDYLAARSYYEEGLEAARTIGYRYGEALALLALGNAYYELGETETAGRYHSQALAIWQDLNDREKVAVSLDTLGLIAQRSGNREMAEAFYVEAVEIQRAMGERRGEAYTLTHLGALLREEARLDEAEEALAAALAVRCDLGDEGGMQDTLAQLALLAWQKGELAQAAQSAHAIAAWLATHNANALEDAVSVYLSCYRILSATTALDPAYGAAAETLRRDGLKLLLDRAALIQDPGLRRAYLENVAAHRDMAALAQHYDSTLARYGTSRS
jgi:predicted ATPase/class 3 adenylate cyclase